MTHSEKVLELLSDGQPHTHMEGYRLGVMLHSRVADLRKKGHRIDCWRSGDEYLYQLVVREPGDAGTVGGSVGAQVLGHPAGSGAVLLSSPEAATEGEGGGGATDDLSRPHHQPTLWEQAA